MRPVHRAGAGSIKESQFRIRVEKRLHTDFMAVCREKDLPAAQVIRHFMKSYVADAQREAQGDLFPPEENESST